MYGGHGRRVGFGFLCCESVYPLSRPPCYYCQQPVHPCFRKFAGTRTLISASCVIRNRVGHFGVLLSLDSPFSLPSIPQRRPLLTIVRDASLFLLLRPPLHFPSSFLEKRTRELKTAEPR